MKLPWIIPQERVVHESEEEINEAYKHTRKGNLQVIEYRDEANRSWWKFFDEYEYRKNIPRWCWFGEGTSPGERKLLIKLDLIIVTFSMMGYWCKFFDSSNLTNAYVSGMEQELKLKGNDLVNTQVMTTIGNIVFMFPIMYLLQGSQPPTFVLSMNFLVIIHTSNIYSQECRNLESFQVLLGRFRNRFLPHCSLYSFKFL